MTNSVKIVLAVVFLLTLGFSGAAKVIASKAYDVGYIVLNK